MLLYAGITLVMVANVDLDVLATDNRPIYTLAEAVAGPVAGIIAVVVGFLTLVSMANGGLLAASRFPFAMGRDALMPTFVSHLHSRYLTPVPAILLSGATIAATLLLFDVERIAKLASAFMIMLFLAVNLAVIVLREAGAQWYKPAYRAPLYPWLQVFGVIACLMLLVVMGPLAALAGIGVAVPGGVLYLFYGRARTERRGVIGIRGRRRELLRSPSSEMRAVTDPTADADVVVALFGSQRSPEGLVEHAAALSEGGTIHVVYLTELPEQVSLEVVKNDPVVESVQRRVEAMANEQALPIVFEAIATRDTIHTIHDLSNRVHCKWLVMEWTGRSAERFTFGNPLGWLKENLSANLAIFHDAGIRYIRKLLVLAEPGPHDVLVTRTADYLAKLRGASLTFVRFVPDNAPLTRVQAEADYLDQVRQLCESPSETLILRGRDEAKAIGRASAAFDLLVTAEKPHKNMLLRMVGGGRDKLTDAAACSVMRLQTPRVEIHSALEQVAQERSAPPLIKLLDRECVGARLEQTKKDALFEHFARTFAEHVPALEASDILAQLHERERTQNTAVGMGVALPHATVDAADRTYLGVFTTAAPVDYSAPDSEGVDVFFATIGPPSERQAHLYLLAGVSKLVLQTSLLYQLRKAEDSGGIVAAIEGSLREDR
jgi:mannitol/fructose-specific phosphotransferase system IIA component (Ntr-type)